MRISFIQFTHRCFKKEVGYLGKVWAPKWVNLKIDLMQKPALTLTLELDILFHQIRTFIKVCWAFVFGLQDLCL